MSVTTDAMPVWGNRYKDEAMFDGAAMPVDPEVAVLGLMLALAYYLEGIQREVAPRPHVIRIASLSTDSM